MTASLIGVLPAWGCLLSPLLVFSVVFLAYFDWLDAVIMNESSNPGWVITMPNDGDFSPISFQDNYLFLEVGFFFLFV